MYSVLKGPKGTLSVLSQNNGWYVTCMQSGQYQEVFTGSRKACEDWVEDNTDPESVN